MTFRRPIKNLWERCHRDRHVNEPRVAVTPLPQITITNH